MKVLNGKRSTLTFQLDNGEVIKIKPGEFSTPFIGNAAIVRTIIGSGKPNQIGFVVSNSYELKMIQEIPLASRYYFATENEAKETILSGKDFEQKDVIYTDPIAEAEIKRLKDKLKTAEEAAISNMDLANNLKKKLKEAEDQIQMMNEASKAPQKRSIEDEAKIKDLTDERDLLKEKYDAISELYEKTKEEKAAISDRAVKTIESKDTEIASLEAKLAEANLKSQNSATPEVNKDGKNLQEMTELYDKLYSEAKEALEKKDAEISQLKEDGAKVYENYTKAKDAVTHIMEKFNITYVDGNYVQTVK